MESEVVQRHCEFGAERSIKQKQPKSKGACERWSASAWESRFRRTKKGDGNENTGEKRRKVRTGLGVAGLETKRPGDLKTADAYPSPRRAWRDRTRLYWK